MKKLISLLLSASLACSAALAMAACSDEPPKVDHGDAPDPDIMPSETVSYEEWEQAWNFGHSNFSVNSAFTADGHAYSSGITELKIAGNKAYLSRPVYFDSSASYPQLEYYEEVYYEEDNFGSYVYTFDDDDGWKREYTYGDDILDRFIDFVFADIDSDIFYKSPSYSDFSYSESSEAYIGTYGGKSMTVKIIDGKMRSISTKFHKYGTDRNVTINFYDYNTTIVHLPYVITGDER